MLLNCHMCQLFIAVKSLRHPWDIPETNSGKNFLEFNLFALVLGFFIFRFFDIFKPYPINKIEDLPGSYGVLGDDVVAGIFTFIFVFIIQNFIDLPII